MTAARQAVGLAAPGEHGAELAAAAFGRRNDPVRRLAEQAGQIAAAAHAMAVRFHQGGKLVVFGIGAAGTDAQHVAVEFMHPVIVGKRALPAISLTSDAATVTAIAAAEGMSGIFAYQLAHLAGPADIALGITPDGRCPSVLAGLAAARAAGLLTVALAGSPAGTADPAGTAVIADHVLTVASPDPRVVKEMQVTTYHILWELVHVFFEQPSVLGPGVIG